MNEITLIIPAKKEPNALPIVLEELKIKYPDIVIFIVIDKTDHETLNSIKKYNCKIIFQNGRGYGNAIIEGLKQSNTLYSCIYYADGSTDPKYISMMLKKVKGEKLDLVFGSRYEKGADSFDDDFITRIGNFIFTFLGNFFMKLNISDLLFTYVFGKTSKFNEMKLEQNDYCLCVEIPFKSKILKYNYSTIPCVERKRVADKKKVKAFSDGLKILIYMIKKYLQTINR
tara:strand:- start:628 stop:1311 length:684 start_codon:yes stop_codon:yes gene_type:complete